MSQIPFSSIDKMTRPVLSPRGKPFWDSEVSANPRIRKFNGTYLNFYTGYSQKGTFWGIGLAHSKDLINWERPEDNLLISSGKENTWNLANVDGSWVFRLSNGGYGMFYEGRRLYNTFETQSFGLAFCDGEPRGKWKEHHANPVFCPTGIPGDFDKVGLLAPMIYLVNGTYWMFYSGYDGDRMRTGLAFSKDLCKWQRYAGNPILDSGPRGRWDHKGAIMLNLFRVGNRFFAFYEGRAENEKLNAGLVTSEDLLNWERVKDEPILTGGCEGSFDEQKLCSPYAFIEERKLYMFFGAHPVGEVPGYTGLAIATLKPWAREAEVCFDEIVP